MKALLSNKTGCVSIDYQVCVWKSDNHHFEVLGYYKKLDYGFIRSISVLSNSQHINFDAA